MVSLISILLKNADLPAMRARTENTIRLKCSCLCLWPIKFTKTKWKRSITALVLVDVSKAFNSIYHSTLLNKMSKIGTSGRALEWFESYLSDRSQRIAPSFSSPLTVSHGVPQSSILRPLLFTVYMKNLSNSANCVSTRSPIVISVEPYVDNTKLYISFTPLIFDASLSQISENLRQVAW